MDLNLLRGARGSTALHGMQLLHALHLMPLEVQAHCWAQEHYPISVDILPSLVYFCAVFGANHVMFGAPTTS
jgi:hypothetical protein